MILAQISLGWASLIVPALVAAALALAVPFFLGRVLPRTMVGLGVNFLGSYAVMLAVTVAYFGVTYVVRGTEPEVLLTGAGLAHIARIAAISALFWGPLVMLQLATQPQNWRPEL